MGLGQYLRKRKFDATPEPKSKPAKRPVEHRLRFVVQEHHARALHYDFRLEMDGVLKSWAVPKGPSMDPHDHHLAIQTEDHPYEYRKFEGEIPVGNYGAGKVIIWDEGWYEPRADGAGETELLRELRKGHITFVLHGKKLRGEFALIKMPHADDDKAWLLIKKGDQYARPESQTPSEQLLRSPQTEPLLAAKAVVRKGFGTPATRAKILRDYPKAPTPWTVQPMLCTLVDKPFDSSDWLFEIKWDGYRAIAAKHGSDYQLYSRNNLDFSGKFLPVTEALHTIKHDVVLDGEIVVVDNDGHAHFEWLQNWHRQPQGHLQYHIFDILWYNGHDIRAMPLVQRKALLQSILPKSAVLVYSDHVEAKGLKLFAEMQRRGLEGMVAKRASSSYQEGERGGDWLKVKTHQRQEVVIGGYTEPRGSRQYLGSLLIGVYNHGQLTYAGHSGGGIPDDQRAQLLAQLQKLERKTSPFTEQPKPNAPVHWVEPKLVCEMEFSEWTSEGLMRQPEFKGLRQDKKPSDVHREKSKTPEAAKTTPGGLPFEPTHLDKIFFPHRKYTKGDLFAYYTAMAKYILPYLQDRPLSLNRMPNGIGGPGFFQKDNPHLPAWVPHADIFSESNSSDLRWIVGGKLETLLYIVQLGSIEINPWNSRVDHLDKPDWIVIDLDPEGVTFNDVIEVARATHKVCEEWSIPTYPKTSGKTGIHIFIPLGAEYTYEQAKNLAHLIALEVNRRQPQLTSVERMPEKRRHKIYLDFLQNREGQTLAAPYSVRPTPEASVSMPLHWDEVKRGLDPMDFTIKNALARVSHTGDLWKPVLGKGIDLKKILDKLDHQ